MAYDDPSPPPTPLGPLLRRNLLFSALVFLALELWRPFFFLTDDNLDGGYPFFMEMGRHLLHGQSPFVSQHLFGGQYDLLRDPTFFSWHPLYLLVSLLSGTPLHPAIIDLDAFALFMMAAAGFVCLAHHLRREEGVKLGDGWLTFFTLSFCHSMIVLATSASWLTFACNQSALPWLALGILQRRVRPGLALVALFTLHELLGGHLEPTISASLFLSIFALGLAWQRRSAGPLLNWGAGNVAALVLALPLLIPTLQGFSDSRRAAGVSMDDMQAYNIPFSSFPTAVFAGIAMWWTHPFLPRAHETYILALGSAAAAWCLLPALAGRGRWRPLEVLVLGLLLSTALMICRPLWITRVMAHLPVLRSMRWPFRELLEFQFFLHLFLVLRPAGYTPVTRRRIAIFSGAIFVLPAITHHPPPTFNTMTWDRGLILSGRYRDFWAQVRPLLSPGDRIAVLIPREIYDRDRFDIPYSLLGTYNYACIAGFTNISGYSPTAPVGQLYTRIAYYPFGAFVPGQRTALEREHPGLKFITLESLRPLKITLSSSTGPVADLTPFVPAGFEPTSGPLPARL